MNTSYVGILRRRIDPTGKEACCLRVIVYEFNAEFCCEPLVTCVIVKEAGVCIWTVIPVVLLYMAALELFTKSWKGVMMRVLVGLVHSDKI